jgi:hypothetical protein
MYRKIISLFGLIALVITSTMLSTRPAMAAGGDTTRLRTYNQVVNDYEQDGVLYHSVIDETFQLVSVDRTNSIAVIRYTFEQNTYLTSGELYYHAVGGQVVTGHILQRNEVSTTIAMQSSIYTGETAHDALYVFVAANGEFQVDSLWLDGQRQ